MATTRVELKLDEETMRWLRMRANSYARPKKWTVQDEIKEMLRFYNERDKVNGLVVPRAVGVR